MGLKLEIPRLCSELQNAPGPIRRSAPLPDRLLTITYSAVKGLAAGFFLQFFGSRRPRHLQAITTV
jgi:hypothetical protein